jgi:hypothetical protein
VEGSYPGMLKTRGYEVRLPADWPPADCDGERQGTKGVKAG